MPRPTLLLACLLAMLAVGVAWGASPREAYNLKADHQEWVEDTLWRGTGDVRIQYQDVTITCDRVDLDLKTKDLVASGEVVLDQGPRRFTAARMEYNLDRKTGTLYDATGEFPPSYHFSGAEIEKVDDTHYRLRDALFTTCELDGSPPWEFHVRSATLEEEGYGHFYGTALRVQGFPVLYLPYLVWPVKQERAAGLLVPSFGYSQRRGAYLGNSLYLPLGRSYDTTVLFDYFTRGWYGLGSEWRWAPEENASGSIEAYAIYEESSRRWEWKVDGRHQQDDLAGFRLLAEIHDLSDIDFFQEFERTFDRNTLRSLYSYAYLTRSWGPYSLNLRLDRRTTFLDEADITLNQLPEAELRVRSTRVGHSSLYWSLVSSVNLFDVDRGGELATTYGRADLFPQISYTLPGPPWLSVSPRAGVRGTLYSARLADDRKSYEEAWNDRSYVTAGVDIVGPSVSRIYGHEDGLRLKHLVEPRIEYFYVSDPGTTSDIPRFDEVDSTPVTNRTRFTLANRLFAKTSKSSSAREVGSLEIYQEYSFDEPLSRGSGGLTSQRGPLVGALRLTPVSGVTVDARASYDTLYDGLQSTSLSAGLYGASLSANLTWYQGWSPSTGDRTSSQMRTYLAFRRQGFPLRLDLHVAYDVEQAEFQQQRVVAYWEGSCWGASVEYRDLRFGAFPTRDYRVIIDFKGLGKMLDVSGGLDQGTGY